MHSRCGIASLCCRQVTELKLGSQIEGLKLRHWQVMPIEISPGFMGLKV